MTAETTDAELVARALGATTEAERSAVFEEISDRYYLTILEWCAKRLSRYPGAAQDVGHEAFLAAFEILRNGKGPAVPEKLGGWLTEFARNRLKEYLSEESEAMRLVSVTDDKFDFLADEDPDAASLERRAQTHELVQIVLGTLTERQQQVFDLRFVQHLKGWQMAPLLGVATQTASNQARNVQNLVGKGVGALVLAQEGRGRCPQLDQMLSEAGFTGRNYGAFTPELRERIVRHYDDCDICQHCPTCSAEHEKLIVPYMPVLIPILFAADFRDRIAESIHATTTQARSQQTRPRPPRRDRTRPGQQHETDDQTRPPSKRARSRRIRYGAGAAAVVVLALIAFLLIPHGHSAAAVRDKTGATGKARGASPAALTADETAAKVAAVPTGGPITAGPLLGPDGRLWDETVATTGTIATLAATNATTFATTTYKLPATLNGDSVIYSGAAAFDGAGHLWLTAYLRTGSSGTTTAVLLQYTPGGGAIQRVAEDSECATGGSDPAQVYEADDGAVWVACPANGGGGGYDYYRMTPGGAITTMTIDNNAQPGTQLYLAYEQLPEAGTGPLVQGPAGSMYGLSSTDIVKFTASGQETMVIDDGKDDPIQLVGNGTGLLEAVAACDVNNAQGEQSEQCINKVNADGSETLIADLPNYDGYNTELVHWAVMDSSGNVWMILDTTGMPVKQYYVEVSPGGAVKTFPFTLPGDTMPVPVSQASPVITPNGGLWSADDQSGATSRWEVIQIVPKQ
jgi:RNA polymerase sigma factor (sigma-70 family)